MVYNTFLWIIILKMSNQLVKYGCFQNICTIKMCTFRIIINREIARFIRLILLFGMVELIRNFLHDYVVCTDCIQISIVWVDYVYFIKVDARFLSSILHV